jgi:hypothetical protein
MIGMRVRLDPGDGASDAARRGVVHPNPASAVRSIPLPLSILPMLSMLSMILLLSPGPARAQNLAVQLGVSIVPETVTVGDPFVVVIAARVPRGTTVEFPDAPDSSGAVQALGPRVLRDGPRSDAEFVEHQAEYSVAAWDTGGLAILRGGVVVQQGSATRNISLQPYRVYVRSVLPEDSALRVPKPVRPLIETSVFPWWILAATLAAAIIAWRLWVWWQRRRGQLPPIQVVDPYEAAMREFDRIGSLSLVESGERGRYVSLMVDVARIYLARRFPVARLSHTSTELLSSIRAEATVPRDALMRLLNEADLIKFGRRPVAPARATELGKDARSLVETEYRAANPQLREGRAA